MARVSFVIPCYCSSKTIINVIEDIRDLAQKNHIDYYEIVLINDGSPDNLDKIIKDNMQSDMKYIRLAKNFSQHNAIMAGLNSCTGDIIVCLDDDGQTPVKEIPKLLAGLDDGCDVVYAKYKTKKHSIFRNIGSSLNDTMLKIMLDKPKDIYISSFFAMKKFVKDEIIKYKNPYPYIGGLILRTTNRIKNIETEHCERKIGNSGYSVKKLLKLYINGLTNFSVKPLRISVFFSIIFILISFIITIYLIIKKYTNPSIPVGWTSTIICILIVGAVITFILGLIGEYLGRIYISINNIPQYVEVKNEKND